MEFEENRGSSSGGAGLLMVPCPNYLEVDSDNEDEEFVIGIRPKSSPQPRRKSSLSEEEESDISEPPSLSGSRRVSFADAVGLNLVQVKEFDKWDIPQLPDFLDSTNQEEEKYFVAPFNFKLTLPSEEIVANVLDQKIELESIELLPGTTILKGVIRVLNISFTKTVYVRISLDNWVSHFDLLCEYIPGSSTGSSDNFAFRLTLVPPFAEEGARVDFCLRYETPNGTFWANNSDRNYVLFCHKRKKDTQDKPQKEHLNKKSCLKSVSQSFPVEESMSVEQENQAADVTIQQKIITESQPNQSGTSPMKSEEDASASQVENRRNRSRRNRRKAARMARVREHFAQKNSDTQESPEKPIPTAQEQNESSEPLSPKESTALSLSKDSNTKKHENFNVADSVTLTNDSCEESKDMPDVDTAVHQNAFSFVCPSEEINAETASDCGHSTGKKDDRKLVCNSSGFAFGTVVAPLYQEVSGKKVGSQLYSEKYNSTTLKEERSNAEKKVLEDTGRCCNDGRVESGECVGATSSSDENAIDKSIVIQDLLEVQTNTVADRMHPIDNCDLLNVSEKCLNLDSEIENRDLSLDQVNFANEAVEAQSSDNNFNSCTDMNRDEAILTTREQDCPFEGEKHQLGDKRDPNVEESAANVALPQSSNAPFQAETASLSSQLPQKECLKIELAKPCDQVNELAVPLQDFLVETLENSSFPFQPSKNEELLDQSAYISDESSFVFETHNLNDGKLHLNPQLSHVPLLDPLTKTKNAMDEIGQEFEDQTVSPNDVTETQIRDANQSSPPLTTEESDQPGNTCDREPSRDSEASIVIVSPISEEVITQSSSELSKKMDQSIRPSSDHHDNSVVLEDQSLAMSPVCTSSSLEEGDQFLLQNTGLEEQSSKNNELITGEVRLGDEGAQTISPTYAANKTINLMENYQCEMPEKINILLEHLENKSHQDHGKFTEITERQELDKDVYENACLLLGEKSFMQDDSTHNNFMSELYDSDSGCFNIKSRHVPKSFEEKTDMFPPSPNSNFTSSDDLELNENLGVMSSCLAITDSENENTSKLFVQNKGLPDISCNPEINLDNKLSETIALSPCKESHEKENAPLPIQDSKCKGFLDQQTNTKGLLIQPAQVQDLTKTMTMLQKNEDMKNMNANDELKACEIIANSDICLGDKSEITKSDVEKDTEDECKDLTEKDGVQNVVEFKTHTDCDSADDITVSGKSELFELLSRIETMDVTIGEETKSWEVMVDEEEENLGLQTTSEEIEDLITSKLDNVKLEMASAMSRGNATDIQKKDAALNELETLQEPKVNDDMFFEPVEMSSHCTAYEGNASVTEKQLNERKARKTADFMDNLPGCEKTDVDYMGDAKDKILLKSNEEERFKIPPRRAKSKLSAPVDNVQKGVQSSRKESVEETMYLPFEIDETNFPCCSKDTNDILGDLKDNSSGSESESGSDDEMELYMHCLRAVYGQQSSPKATKPEPNRDKEFKRLSSIRSKRLSTSLPSISESLDEELSIMEPSANVMEQEVSIQEPDTETVEVQPVCPVLSDSNLKEENGNYLGWKQSFSCRNILKSLLYAMLVVIFLAVSYHYDFIACFGLYVISVIWLFFQGKSSQERRS